MNPPDEIWLQYCDSLAEWTWSGDRINDVDIQYVIATPERLAAEKLLEASESLLAIVDAHFDPSEFAPGIGDEIQQAFDALLEVVNDARKARP